MARNNDSFTFGFVVSICGHAIIVLFMIFGFGPLWSYSKPVIYSVTLEGGSVLGGVDHTLKDAKKISPVALPISKPEPPKKEAAKPVEKAEVSLDEKKEPEKEKPKPTAQPEATKSAPKPTVAPTAKPKKKTPQEELAELKKQLEKNINKYTDSVDAGGKTTGAAEIDPKGRGSGGKNTVVMPREFFIYRDQLEAMVKRGWNWPDTGRRFICEVAFQISPAGQISNVRIHRSSGNSLYDESVVRAVQKANPVPPPPAVVYRYFSDVISIFDSAK